MAKHHGLAWVDHDLYGLEPRWTVEPKIEKIESLARKHLKLEKKASCNVSFYAQGAFNKLYQITTEAGCFLMRVTLPVDPFHKTNSEVATTNFVRKNSGIPVPKIFAYNDSSENELGFEWILMELLPGATLQTKWRKFSVGLKRDLVKEVAQYQAQLFLNEFPAIGNLFYDPEEQCKSRASPRSTIIADMKQAKAESHTPVLSRVVSIIFFWGQANQIAPNVPHGPFFNSADWTRARLNLVLKTKEKIIEISNDKDVIEKARRVEKIAERLLELLPSILPPSSTPEPTVLCHDDLTEHNILVDDDGKITGVIDWECVSAVPFWKAGQFPSFLQGRDRKGKPDQELYVDPVDSALYWEHVEKYEKTILREIFLKEMERLQPEWMKAFEDSEGTIKADLEEAVLSCDNESCMDVVEAWLDELENGKAFSLRKTLFNDNE
jgi:aminoglycoside phosphotransferase (APT) family kinase protein